MESDEPITNTDEEGNALLAFDLDIDDGTEEIDTISRNYYNTYLKKEEKYIPVSKEIELYRMIDKVTINGKKFDHERIDLRQKKGVSEVWEVYNKPDEMGGMIHPFHIHGTQFKIISRDGREPAPNEQGLKDSVLIEPGEQVRLLVT